MHPGTLHDRLREALHGRPVREVSDITKVHPETVRRYLGGAAPSADFLGRLCSALGIDADWLLMGVGAPTASESMSRALSAATALQVLDALSTSIENFSARVDRAELNIQTLNVRIAAYCPDRNRSLYSKSNPANPDNPPPGEVNGDRRAG